MKNQIWYRIGTWNLKIFFSISFGLHLLFFATVALLLPDFKIDRLPPLNIEVSLLSVVAQEKPIAAPIPPIRVKAQAKKEEKEPPPPLPVQDKMKVIPVDDPPMEVVKSEVNMEVVKSEVNNEVSNKIEETMEEEPIPQATNISSNSETMVTLQGDNSPISEDPLLQPLSSSEESKVVKYPSLFEREIALTQPKYAENPKPTYPQEARKRGYQGEVILKVEVLSDGRVGQVEVKRSSGHEILDCSALTAVKQWKFLPAKRGRNTIPLWVNIPIKFQLQ
jgi:protein TonB